MKSIEPCHPISLCSTFSELTPQGLCSDIAVAGSNVTTEPWMQAYTVYQSQGINKTMGAFLGQALKGIPNVTFGQVVQTYQDRGCKVYPHGGIVRDILNGDLFRDMDTYSTCSGEQLLEICHDFVGVEHCKVHPFGTVIRGKEGDLNAGLDLDITPIEQARWVDHKLDGWASDFTVRIWWACFRTAPHLSVHRHRSRGGVR